MLTLEIKARDEQDSADVVRKSGAVPAVFYGPKEKTTTISVDARKLERVWKEAGETTIVTLKGAGDDKDTLIHDAQFDPLTGHIIHMDFYVLEKGKKVKISVPLEFTGVAPAEKAGHIVVKTLHEIDIEVIPQELPHSLSVDLSKLANVGDHIVAKDIALPLSATLETGDDEIVASVKEFKEEKEEVTAAPETVIIGEEKATGEAAEQDGAESGEAKKPESKKE